MTVKTTVNVNERTAEKTEAVIGTGAAVEKAEPEKKTRAAKKITAKRTADKKTAGKKELKVNTFIEYYGKQVEEKTIIANVKKVWTKSGKKVGDIKQMDLYIKPEENMVYYVINGTTAGSVGL